MQTRDTTLPTPGTLAYLPVKGQLRMRVRITTIDSRCYGNTRCEIEPADAKAGDGKTRVNLDSLILEGGQKP